MTTNTIEQAVYAAMQDAEEIWGPEPLDYIALMTRIAAEAARRAATVGEALKDDEKPAAAVVVATPAAKVLKTFEFELSEDGEGKPVYAFATDDMVISDAFSSECSRFEVDPEEHYGISLKQARDLRRMNRDLRIGEVITWAHEHINANAAVHETGGGCRAIHVPRDDGAYWLITVRDDADVPTTITEPVTVGLYEAEDSERWVLFHCADLPAAARLIESCASANL